MVRPAPLWSLALLFGLAASAEAQVKLEYKFVEGTKTSSKTTTKTHQILNANGTDFETNAEETVVVSSEVGKAKPDGTRSITQKIESLRAQIELPGGMNVTFDSANPDAKIENPQLAFLGEVFKALVGVSYTIALDPSNKVKFVEGTETFAAKVEALDETAKAVLRGKLSPEKIKTSFDQAHGNLPSVLARAGEPWETTEVSEIGGGQTLTFRKRYEYQGTVTKDGRTLDKIGVKSTEVTYAMDPNSQSSVKVSKSDLKIDSSQGTLLFDREAGVMVESKGVTRIKGDMTLTANGQDVPSTLDLTLDTASALEKSAK